MNLLLIGRIVGVVITFGVSFMVGSLFWDFVFSDRFLRVLLSGRNPDHPPAALVARLRSEGVFQLEPGEIDLAGNRQGGDYVQDIFLLLESTRRTSRSFRLGLVFAALAMCALGYWAGEIIGAVLSAVGFFVPSLLPLRLGNQAQDNRFRIFQLVLWNLNRLKREEPIRAREFVGQTPVLKPFYDVL